MPLPDGRVRAGRLYEERIAVAVEVRRVVRYQSIGIANYLPHCDHMPCGRLALVLLHLY